jgi:RecA-family ATPase
MGVHPLTWMSIDGSANGEPRVKRKGANDSQAKPEQRRRPDVLCLADVEPEPVQWLWEPYIPLKMITLVSGDPGVGKTTLAMTLAAGLTTGRGIGGARLNEVGNVLYLTNENSPSHVLRPRFDALGGDARRFFVLQGTILADGSPASITLGDTEQLEEALTANGVRLVVIDPLQSFLGSGVDAHRANETRPVLDGLAKLADRTGCAIVITRHFSKGIGGSAIYRGMGSIDITGAARCELVVGRDPEDPSRVIMAHSKSNLGPLGTSLAYSIGKEGLVEWHGTSSHKANDLLGAPVMKPDRTAMEEAQEFLVTALTNGPQTSNEITEQAKNLGISKATLRRAKKSLGVAHRPAGLREAWMVELPSVAHSGPELLKGGG